MNLTITRFQHKRVARVDICVVVDPHNVQFFYGSTKIHQAGIIDSPQCCFRSAVASGIGAGFNALHMQAEIAKGEVAHLDDESSLLGQAGLLERNVTTKRCFDSETNATVNAS